VAAIFNSGPRFDGLLTFYTMRGPTTPKHHIVLVKVERAAPLVSPAYDQGQTEPQITNHWRRYWERLWDRRLGPS